MDEELGPDKKLGPGEEPAEEPGEGTGEEPGEEPGEGTGEEPGEEQGKEPSKEQDKKLDAKPYNVKSPNHEKSETTVNHTPPLEPQNLNQ